MLARLHTLLEQLVTGVAPETTRSPRTTHLINLTSRPTSPSSLARSQTLATSHYLLPLLFKILSTIASTNSQTHEHPHAPTALTSDILLNFDLPYIRIILTLAWECDCDYRITFSSVCRTWAEFLAPYRTTIEIEARRFLSTFSVVENYGLSVVAAHDNILRPGDITLTVIRRSLDRSGLCEHCHKIGAAFTICSNCSESPDLDSLIEPYNGSFHSCNRLDPDYSPSPRPGCKRHAPFTYYYTPLDRWVSGYIIPHYDRNLLCDPSLFTFYYNPHNTTSLLPPTLRRLGRYHRHLKAWRYGFP